MELGGAYQKRCGERVYQCAGDRVIIFTRCGLMCRYGSPFQLELWRVWLGRGILPVLHTRRCTIIQQLFGFPKSCRSPRYHSTIWERFFGRFLLVHVEPNKYWDPLCIVGFLIIYIGPKFLGEKECGETICNELNCDFPGVAFASTFASIPLGTGGAMTTAFISAVVNNPWGHSYPSLLHHIRKALLARGLGQLPQLSSSQRFPINRPFNLSDIVPNHNKLLGRQFNKNRRRKVQHGSGQSAGFNTMLGILGGFAGGALIGELF